MGISKELKSIVEPLEEGGFQINFFLAEPFDYSFAFRAILSKLEKSLQESGNSASIELPEQTEMEDFVEGSLIWNGCIVSVYFEHSLGYLALTAANKELLEKLAAKIAEIRGSESV